MYRFDATVTVVALDAATEETYTITETKASKAQVGDVIAVSPKTAPEAGWGVIAAWVDSPGVIKVKASNFAGTALTGGSLVLRIAVIR